MKIHPPLSILAATLGLLAGLGGCALPDPDDLVLGRSYQPANVHTESRRLNPQLRRLLVLPLTSEVSGTVAADALATLESALKVELQRTERFELAWLTREELTRATGRADWRGDEALPADFFQDLQARHGCDGVLFARLTRYEAYPPLAVGWHLKLVGCPTPQVLWEFDEVFDAREAGVVNGARRFQQRDQAVGRRPTDSRVALSSPRRFVAYAAHATFQTLPGR